MLEGLTEGSLVDNELQMRCFLKTRDLRAIHCGQWRRGANTKLHAGKEMFSLQPSEAFHHRKLMMLLQ